jgi:non-ribosomal peptide synthetase component F
MVETRPKSISRGDVPITGSRLNFQTDIGSSNPSTCHSGTGQNPVTSAFGYRRAPHPENPGVRHYFSGVPMSKLYPVKPEFAAKARIGKEAYQRLYAESVNDPEGFWKKIGERLDWSRQPSKIKNVSYDPKDFHIRWYEDGELNVAANCLDRHLEKRGDKTAIIFEGDDPNDSRHISYRQLHEEVCKFANTLKHLGVKKGDRVAIYLPMIPEAAVSMLACARIGAVHSVVFGGFSPDSLAGRIADSTAKVVITADEGVRGGKKIPLKANVDAALQRPGTNSVETVIVVKRTGSAVPMQSPRDRYYHNLMEGQSVDCPAEPVEAEHPLFILYTSGSTGKPKGVLHTSGGYLVYASYTHEMVFDLREDDIYWCTADVGWVTGHSYVVYGPLANGATTVMFDGVPNYPDTSRFWQVVEKHKVSLFYTAPTAIRALMREGEGADQPGSLGVVLPRGRRRALPDRRHLVADRDRRHPDYSARRRDRRQAGLGHLAVLRHQAGGGRHPWRHPGWRYRRQPGHYRFVAGPDAHGVWRSSALYRNLFHCLSWQLFHRRRRAPR